MAFNLKDEQAVANLRELAKLQGVSMSAAASQAIEERLARSRERRASLRVLELAEDIRNQSGFKVLTNEESDAEIYDEAGLPK